MGSKRHTTCFDTVFQEDLAIAQFLAEDPENFVIGTETSSGLVFECQNLTSLKTQWRLPGNPIDRPPYKVFYEGEPHRTQRIPGGRVFVKLGSHNFLTLHPTWLWSGPVPEPRIFLLDRVGSVNYFISSEFLPRLLPTTEVDATGMDRNNQLYPTDVFRLVPVEADLLFDTDTELVEDDGDDDDEDEEEGPEQGEHGDDDIVFVGVRRRTNPDPYAASGSGSASGAIHILGGGYANQLFGLRSLQ